jgi:hypothetical protein
MSDASQASAGCGESRPLADLRRDARRVFGSAAFVIGFCIVLWIGCALFGRAWSVRSVRG